MEQMSLITALRLHCGAPGESLHDFSAQYKRLTAEDRDWFRREFPAIGVEIIDSPAPVQ